MNGQHMGAPNGSRDSKLAIRRADGVRRRRPGHPGSAAFSVAAAGGSVDAGSIIGTNDNTFSAKNNLVEIDNGDDAANFDRLNHRKSGCASEGDPIVAGSEELSIGSRWLAT